MLPKIGCVFHQGQTITNFCTQKTCLLPLCPCCVKIHTAEHMSMRTTPQYEQINELLNEIAQNIGICSKTVENDLHSIVHFTNMKKGLENLMQQAKNDLFDRVDAIKRDIINKIHDVFSQIQQDIQESFHDKQIEQKIGEFQKVLTKQCAVLGRLEESLYTNKAMRTVIKFQAEDIVKKCQLAHSINEQLIQLCQAPSVSLISATQHNASLITTFIKEEVLKYRISHNRDLEISPLDFLSNIEPLQQKSSMYSSPSQHASKRSTSEDRRNKQGIRLVGLERQLQHLDQTKKMLGSKRGKATQLVDCLKDSPLDYRSLKTITNQIQLHRH